jgi:phage gpG-like protein
MKIVWEVEGVPILVRSFERLDRHVSDLRPVWDNAERRFHKLEDSQFKSEGARGESGKWKPLSRPYAVQKAKRYGVQPILRASGRMEAALTGHTGDSVVFKEPQEFGIGTSLAYAGYHQRGPGSLPKRPLIDPTDQDKRDFSKEIQRDILNEMRRDPAMKNLEVQE